MGPQGPDREVVLTENEPSPRELDVLKALWALGSGSVREVHQWMCPDGELAFNTVQTLLRIMEEKGLVRHRAEGRTFVYEPNYSRDRVTVPAAAPGVRRRARPGRPQPLAGEGRQRRRTAGAGAADRRGPEAEGVAGRREKGGRLRWCGKSSPGAGWRTPPPAV